MINDAVDEEETDSHDINATVVEKKDRIIEINQEIKVLLAERDELEREIEYIKDDLDDVQKD